MCGIAGFIEKDSDTSVERREGLLDRMCKTIVHRGPDEQGTIVRGRAALGMRRLSIIDLKTGQQPIFNDAGNLAIVFNGEIYNYRELKKELESLGHRFKTNSDTETIVRAYEQFGADCLKKLRGMFAFAIWDLDKEELFLARDRVGKKPLFYTQTPSGAFVFGSELKVILEHGETKRETDPEALSAYLTFGYVPEELCIFRNVHKLKPGHFLKYSNGEATTRQYWDFTYASNGSRLSEAKYVETLREKIEDAVNVRLISEVPLGAFLSGGVDSSSVVAMMSKLSDSPVKTFSIGFKEDSFNELKYARIAAKHFNTEHHEFIVTPDFVDVADEMVWHFDEPFADSSSLPTFMLSKMARQYVTVVLSGDGGDEVFGGYSRYMVDRQRRYFGLLPKAIRAGLFRQAARILPAGAFGKNYLYNVSLDPLDRYIDSVSQVNTLNRDSIYHDDFKSSLGKSIALGENLFNDIAFGANSDDSITRLLYLDSKTYLPGVIMTKVDRMSMANSLETRSPLLDHELIDFAGRIPSSLKINGNETKYVFKKAMEGIVPHEILYREKQGFGVPINEWINAQLRERILSELTDQRTFERGYLKRSSIDHLIAEHSGLRRDHSHLIWGLWMLELWHRKYIDV
jgi:asparagine synthase (glutamine-hydrolysing)